MYLSDVTKKVSDTLLDTIKFSLYENLSGKMKLGDISLAQWLERIRTNPRKEEILAIRTKNLSKDDLRKKKFPFNIVTPHAQIKGERLDSNFIALTGLLFIDVDGDINPDECKNTLFALPEVIAVWKSFSGKGVHGVAHVANLPAEPAQFRQAHKTYFEELSTRTGYSFDKNVCKLTHSMLESYDNEPLIKSSWTSYDLVCPAKSGQDIIREEEDKINTVARFYVGPYRYRLTLESYAQPVVETPEGRPFYECFLNLSESGKIYEGGRFTKLSAFLNNFILLNPQAEFTDLLNTMKNLNMSYCSPTLPEEEIRAMVTTKWAMRNSLQPIWKRKEDGSLYLKYFWIAPDVENKLKAYYHYRKSTTEAKIQSFFDVLPELGMKVTTRLISEISEVGERTVKRYLTSEQKQIITAHNKPYIKRTKKAKT